MAELIQLGVLVFAGLYVVSVPWLDWLMKGRLNIFRMMMLSFAGGSFVTLVLSGLVGKVGQ